MSSDKQIEVSDLSKVYKVFSSPQARFKQFVFKNKKYYSEFAALKNITFSVKKGETIAVIGKNGSGKSTLLQIIAGTLKQTRGTIEVKGKVAALLELGSGFNPEFTGKENVFLYGSILGLGRQEMMEKYDDIQSFADIGEFIDQPVKTYSSGMYARLAFAVAIHVEPEILIVDEALSVGDVFFQQKCNIYMKEKMKDVTKLIVSHDLSSVAKLADRAIVLNEGEIVFEGRTLQAIEYYIKTLHVETFMQTESIYGKTQSDSKNPELINLGGDFESVSEEELGGALQARIEKYRITVNDDSYKGYITAGDRLKIIFTFSSQKEMGNVVYGYLVNDKYGNSIFGENTISSQIDVLSVEVGLFLVEMELIWPEIKEGAYTITLGIGEGEHELNHVIQCWAHNIILLNNVNPNVNFHGLFNNKIKQLTVKGVKL